MITIIITIIIVYMVWLLYLVKLFFTPLDSWQIRIERSHYQTNFIISLVSSTFLSSNGNHSEWPSCVTYLLFLSLSLFVFCFLHLMVIHIKQWSQHLHLLLIDWLRVNNAVLGKTLKCLGNQSEVAVNTGPYFNGKIYVEGALDDSCTLYGNQSSSKEIYTMTINHVLCGSRVVVSKSASFLFISKVIILVLSCFLTTSINIGKNFCSSKKSVK